MIQLAFILLTISSITAGNIILKIFYEMIQSGGGLDIVFHWQKMLENFYAKGANGNKFYMWLEKALGGCERCTSFWFMPIWFMCYYLVSKCVFHVWITDFITISGFWKCPLIVITNWFWYSLFHAIGSQGGFYILTKLFKRKSHAV